MGLFIRNEKDISPVSSTSLGNRNFFNWREFIPSFLGNVFNFFNLKIEWVSCKKTIYNHDLLGEITNGRRKLSRGIFFYFTI